MSEINRAAAIVDEINADAAGFKIEHLTTGVSLSRKIETEVPAFAIETLAKILATVEHAISRDAGRSNLCGVLLENGYGQEVTATATDGKRLAQAKTAIDSAALALPDAGFHLSREDVKRIIAESKRLAKLRKPGTPMFNAILAGSNGATPTVLVLTEMFDGADRAEIRCRALTDVGPFPNYKDVVPKLDVYADPVQIDGRFLADVGKALGPLTSEQGIVMRTGSNVTPIRFDVKASDVEAFEIVMPMRLDE